MRNKLIIGVILATVALAGVVSVLPESDSPDAEVAETSSLKSVAKRPVILSPIQPIPDSVDVDLKKVTLGAKLFQDKLLSRDKSVSCATCHDIAEGGDDGLTVSLGIEGKPGSVNAPTVLNSGFSFRQFWDGRAESLEDQIDGPIEHPSEMDMTWEELVARLNADRSYPSMFDKAYGRRPDRAAVKNAIAEFERALITPGSPFDQYLLGDTDAISEGAIEGYELFVDFGCATCHQGVNVGGNMFQHLGVMADFFENRREPTEADNGRFNVTGKERDRHKFKVPTLRNVADTAPYFHDGSVATLDEAVRLMAAYQLGTEPTPEETERIVEFLETLSSSLPKDVLGIMK